MVALCLVIYIIVNVSDSCFRKCQARLQRTVIITRPVLPSSHVPLSIAYVPFREEFLIKIIALWQFILLLALVLSLSKMLD